MFWRPVFRAAEGQGSTVLIFLAFFSVVVILGFEQPEYTVQESDGSVDVCVRVFEPQHIELFASAIISTVSDSAEGIMTSLNTVTLLQYMLC